MRRGKISICFLVAFFIAVLPSLAFSATYYVDSSAGDDNHNGLSVDTAWRTIDKVNNMMPQLPVGSDILFKRGEQFSGDSLYISVGGVETDPMVIGAYGEGPKPVLKDDTHIICTRKDLGYIHVQDIFFQNSGPGSAIYFAAENLHNIAVSRVDIRDSGQNGIFMAAVNGYLIEDCTIKNCGLSGIIIYGTDQDWPPITNGVIRGNEIVNMDPVHGDGITLHRSDGARHGEIGPNHILENNRIGNCGENAYDLTSGSHIILRHCEGYGSNEIEVLVSADDVLVDRCYFHDGNRDGIYIAPLSTRARISNTIIQNMAGYSLTVGDDSGSSMPVTDVEIFHNTIYHTANTWVINVIQGALRLQFKNNIVFAKASSIPRFVRYLVDSCSPDTTQSDFNNNIWWSSNGDTTKFGWDNAKSEFFTFANWQDNYHQGSNSLFTAPGFVDAAGGDYRLKKGSKGIDTGVNVGIIEDYDGLARPQGKQVDIGAFEYLQQRSSIFLLLRGLLSRIDWNWRLNPTEVAPNLLVNKYIP